MTSLRSPPLTCDPLKWHHKLLIQTKIMLNTWGGVHLVLWSVNTRDFFFHCQSFCNTGSHWEELPPPLLPGEIKTTSGKGYSINPSPQYFFTPFIISKAGWGSDSWFIFIILFFNSDPESSQQDENPAVLQERHPGTTLAPFRQEFQAQQTDVWKLQLKASAVTAANAPHRIFWCSALEFATSRLTCCFQN